MADNSSPILDVRGLCKSYRGLAALEPLDLAVPAGQRLALVGHNGSGKTTLLSMIAGLLEPTDGWAAIDGYPIGSIGARAAVSYLGDAPVLYDDLSLSEHIEVTCRLHRAEDWKATAEMLLDGLGLTGRAGDLPSRFSRGLRQKAAMLLALVRPFSLLLVDEPFVGLDPPGQERFVEYASAAAANGAAVVVATHQMDYAAHADRCLALRDGAVAYDGPPSGADIPSLVG